MYVQAFYKYKLLIYKKKNERRWQSRPDSLIKSCTTIHHLYLIEKNRTIRCDCRLRFLYFFFFYFFIFFLFFFHNELHFLNIKRIKDFCVSPRIGQIRNDDVYRGLMFHCYKRYKTQLVDFHRGIHYASLIDSSITANWMIQLTGRSFTFWRIIITQWFRVINSIMPYCFGIIRYFNVLEFIGIPAYCKWDIR